MVKKLNFQITLFFIFLVINSTIGFIGDTFKISGLMSPAYFIGDLIILYLGISSFSSEKRIFRQIVILLFFIIIIVISYLNNKNEL
jgi:hypothetical protein